jgi:putative MATE family efflux protein
MMKQVNIEAQRNRVDEFIENPKKALFTLAIPTIIGMSVQIAYNIADTAFVGRLGAESIAALTFSFPLFFVLISINSGIGVGMGSRISRLLGARNREEAENTALHGLLISIIFAAVIFTAGRLTLRSLFTLFGASEEVLPLAVSYMSIILLAVVFIFSGYIFNSIFAAQGDTKTPMKVQISALILNIILDPIFIYTLNFGVRGAAIATLIAFMTSLLLFIYFIRKKSYLRIRLSAFSFSFQTIKDIFIVGGPAMFTMLLLSFYIVFINRFMAHFGTNYVATFGMVSRLESVSVMPMVALSMALLTLVGMFYGAERYDLLKSTIFFTMKVGIAFTVLIGLLFFAFPSLFLRIFTSDKTLLNLGHTYIRINVFTFPLMTVAMITSRSMQGMGHGLPGLMINITRIVIVAVPLAYVFVFVLGYSYLSIAVAMVIGGIASNITAFVWLKINLGKLATSG